MELTDIEAKILQLESGRFQKMCNELLCKMHYTPYNYVGSQSGTNKTILGTPDAIFLDSENKYVYVEYTVQQSGLPKKVKEDTEKCLKDIKKEGLEKIFSRIIYMHSCKNISPSLNEEIKSLCNNIKFEIYGIDYIANLIKNDFPEIAKDYLQLNDNNIQMVGRFSEEALQQISEKIKNDQLNTFKDKSIDEIKNKIDALYNEAILIVNNQDSQLYMSSKNIEKLKEIFKTLQMLQFYYKDKSTKEAKQYYYNNLVILCKFNMKEAIKYYEEIPDEIKNANDTRLLYANFLINENKLDNAEAILYDLYYNKKYLVALDSLARCYFLNKKHDKVVELLKNLKGEEFDGYGFLASMFIISKNYIKKLNEKEILKLNNSKFKNMPLFYTATAHLLFDLKKRGKKHKEQFKKGIKYLKQEDILVISTMCDEARIIGLSDEMIKYLYTISLTPSLETKLLELLINKISLKNEDIQKLDELRNKIDKNDIDIDYIDGRLLEAQGKEIEAISKYEKSYNIKGTLNSAYKYIELSMKNFSKIKTDIIEKLDKDNKIYSRMLIVEAFKYNNDYENAIKNAYKLLYLLNGKMSNKECLKQYWTCTIMAGNTLHRDVEYVCNDTVVTLESCKTKKIKSYVLEDNDFYQEGRKVLKTEIIRTTSELGIELINRKKDEFIIFKDEKYIIKDIKDKYTYFSHICFDNIGIEKDKNIKIFRTSENNVEEFAKQLKEQLNEIEESKNKQLDIYQESSNIPLSFFGGREKSADDYAKIINTLLIEEERCLYAGEPINIKVENGFVIDLTSIIILAIYDKLKVFTDDLCKKIYITTSLKNKVQYYYENLLKKQGKKETTIGIIKQEDGEQKLAIDETQINDRIEFWKEIYKVLNKFKVENVESEKNEFFDAKRNQCFDKVQFDLIELAKKKNLPYICDDLLMRKIAGGIYKVNHTNSITLVQYLYKDDYYAYLDDAIKLVKNNYIYVFYGEDLSKLFFAYYKDYSDEIKAKVENVVKQLLNTKTSFNLYIGIFINIINNLKTMEYVKIQNNVYLNNRIESVINLLIFSIKLACDKLKLNYDDYEKQITKEIGAIELKIKVE